MPSPAGPRGAIPTLEKSICLRAFAKINLGLSILGKRPDGYHEIRTIYQTIALHDRLEISLCKASEGIHLECDNPAIPSGRGNLVYRACELWRRARGFRGGISARLEKMIPAGSGLGGASSDAAAAVEGLERLTGAALPPSVRFSLAARLGSDVPLFLLGGRVLGCGRGEEVYPLPDLPPRKCLVVFPGFSVSTAEAYQEASLRLTGQGNVRKIERFGARPRFSLMDWGPAENDFEHSVFAKWPELARLKRQLIRAGAEIASLTGSGSAVFAVCESARQLSRVSELIPKEWHPFRSRMLSRAEYLRLLCVR
jgi:4-diphosphocytidyl-2-C-methyl-D-erythritol kinase